MACSICCPPKFLLLDLDLARLAEAKTIINGLALCRGDVSRTKCKTCVIHAGKELRYLCPGGKRNLVRLLPLKVLQCRFLLTNTSSTCGTSKEQKKSHFLQSKSQVGITIKGLVWAVWTQDLGMCFPEISSLNSFICK